MKGIQSKFFQLLRLSLAASSSAPEVRPGDWRHLYELAKKQALLGIAFDGIIKMGDAAKLESDLLIKWLGQCKQIEKRNHKLNEAAVKVSDYFKRKGFETCILKGQGNAMMYPNPLHRTSGDIDIWVSGNPSDVIHFVHSVSHIKEKASYHHIDFPPYNDIAVEVHYRPCYLQNPIYNERLQKYFRMHAQEQFSHYVKTKQGDLAVPTVAFNMVYQLVHIYNHLFQEGIGLRQILDYYLVLLNVDVPTHGSLQRELKYLGLWKFAGAVMWVLHIVLGLQEEQTIAPFDEKRGKMLLDEIMKGGNFGQFDERYSWGADRIGHNTQRLFRDLRLLRYYPSEAISEPFFRQWHWCWRKLH